MDKQTFDEIVTTLCSSRNSIHLDAGGVDKAETLFDGIIVGLRILTGNDSPSMVVECRDNAYAATQGRKNRIFEKKKDDDIIKEVLAAGRRRRGHHALSAPHISAVHARTGTLRPHVPMPADCLSSPKAIR